MSLYQLLQKIQDIIIIWAWAAGLFAAINISSKYNKLILEKNSKPWIKVLLSWWERANVSNMDIEGERDYFGQNKKALKSILTRYNQWDIMSWFADNWINIIEEDRWRLILESGDSKELLAVLVRKAQENNSEIKTEQNVKVIRTANNISSLNSYSLDKEQEATKQIFEVTTESWKKYFTKKVIVSSGWKSFFQVGTTWEWYNFAKEFWLNIIPPTRALWGLSTKKDFSNISGTSCDVEVKIFDKNDVKKNVIYSENWPLLFTHFWVSGPIIFNAGNAIGEYISWINLLSPHLTKEGVRGWSQIDIIYENYLKEYIYLELVFDIENTPKKIVKYFSLDIPLNKNGTQVENNIITLDLQNWRSWKEAKATWGWIDINELDKFMQSKKEPGLFFIGEVCDITWKTGGFNLQWAWSSAYCCGEFF